MPRGKKQWEVNGYQVRSKLEMLVLTDLVNKGVDFEYEAESYVWLEKLPRAFCAACGEKAVFVERSYTPDVFLSNGIIVEVKGIFTSHDRKIAAAMQEQHPNLDIRMVFQRDNKLSRSSSTRYSTWCEKKGIKCAIAKIPEEWVIENINN